MRFFVFVALLAFCAATPVANPKPNMPQDSKTAETIKSAMKDKADLPVLQASEKEHDLLHKAVTEVVRADQKVPEEKKEEVIATTVQEIKKEFRDMEMTHGDLIEAVETKAAKHEAAEKAAKEAAPASTDRAGHHGGGGHGGHYGGHGYGHHGYGYGHRYGYGYGGYYPGYYGYYSGYYPGYYPGYGYNDCLYSYSYPYCQQQLYGAYAYYRSVEEDKTDTATSTKTTTGQSGAKIAFKADETPKAIIANLTQTLKKVESAAVSDRLEDAAKHAEVVKEITKKVEDAKLIAREDAKEIKKMVENVQKAAAAGNQDATLEHAKILKDQVDPSGAQGTQQDRDVNGDDVRCNATCGIGSNYCANCCLSTANNGGDPLGRKFKGGHCNWFTCWCEQ